MSEPISAEQARKLWDMAEGYQRHRAEIMPDEQSAIRMLFEAHQRLKELGWKEAIYAPKDRRELLLIEAGSSGIHTGYCEERPMSEFPAPWFWIAAHADLWPSKPVLFKEPPK